MIQEAPEADLSGDQEMVEAVVARGPGGAFAVGGLAVAIVMAMWLAFYMLVYVARGGT